MVPSYLISPHHEMQELVLAEAFPPFFRFFRFGLFWGVFCLFSCVSWQSPATEHRETEKRQFTVFHQESPFLAKLMLSWLGIFFWDVVGGSTHGATGTPTERPFHASSDGAS
ncbi:hypothetical protein GUJ93_ZPchr0015g6908 [Zizania palustris]|uniref:Uncharacterized protein n=1 Tax=Zizania palustris TaxID=103762 RepID=A0A8J5THE0_ZIZPA|nr:hypothetical protein GUJ93_ZPchr0015g6908 [Zizania palustris]